MSTIVSLISIGTWLGNKIGDKGFESIYSKIVGNKSFDKRFYKKVEITSKILQEKYPDVLGGSIDYFFKNEKVFSELFKLLFKNSIVDSKIVESSFDTMTLPLNFIDDFILTLKTELLKDKEFNDILADKEIFLIVVGLASDFKLIAKNSTLALSEIITIKKNLLERERPGLNYEEFLELYCKNALHNLSQVNFIGLGVDLAIKRKRKNLQDVFVKPSFQMLGSKFVNKQLQEKNDEYPFEQEPKIISYDQIFEHSEKIVVLGNPGSGKSVLIKSIICDIIEVNKIKSQKIFPLRVELRKYLSYKKLNSGNFQKYILTLLESEYGLTNLDLNFIDNIFKNEFTYVFFDGLDEIFKIEDKFEIKNDIENFHNVYEKVKSLTTSRIIGYEEAKLNDDIFCELVVLSFNNIQITEYVEKWYEKEEDNDDIRKREVEGFLTKMHEIDGELVSNPLLLSLIVILYRNILKLPESKLEIYQSCTKTLVDKWDASKDLVIDIEFDIYKIKEKILADLAYWQYEQLSSEEISITYTKARKTVEKSIVEKLDIDDTLDSNELAESFMNYAQKRSLYFDNNFTHKTFLEYYTAYWIYSNIEKKHKIIDRNQIISKYINNSFWHIVLELLLNMIDKDQADSEIMDDLIQLQLEKDTSLPFLLSTINRFKNVSKRVIMEVLNRSIEKLTGIILVNKNDFYEFDRETIEAQIYDGIKELYHNDAEINKSIVLKLTDSFKKDNSTVMNSFILHFELELFSDQSIELDSIMNPELRHLMNTNSYLYFLSCYFSREKYFNNIEIFISNFGVKELFTTFFAVYESIQLGDYLSFYINYQILPLNIADMSSNISKLNDLGLFRQDILDHIKNRKYYYLPRNSFNSLVERINVEEDIFAKKIMLMIFVKSQGHSNYGKEYMKTLKKDNILYKILKIRSVENKIKFIEEII